MIGIVIFVASNYHLSASASSLTCSPSISCPSRAITCECQGVSELNWRVISPDVPSPPLFRIRYTGSSTGDIALPISDNGYSSILQTIKPNFDSELTLSLIGVVTVQCIDDVDLAMDTIEIALPPLNLRFVVPSPAWLW